MPRNELSIFANVASTSLALALAGCIGVSQAHSQSADDGASPEEVAAANPKLKVCNMVPADDGLLDDLEDEDRQTLPIAGRGGSWWKHADEHGSRFNDELSIVDHEDGEGFKAIYASGSTGSTEEAYGVLIGVDLSPAGFYDATKYAGISFKAKVDPDSTKKVRFKVSDINTHPKGEKCSDCWNHFGKDMTLSNEWQEYKVLFAELKQEPFWGDPRPPSIDPEQLMALDWSIKGGGKFGLYLDDVQFLVCE